MAIELHYIAKIVNFKSRISHLWYCCFFRMMKRNMLMHLLVFKFTCILRLAHGVLDIPGAVLFANFSCKIPLGFQFSWYHKIFPRYLEDEHQVFLM